MVLKFRQIVFVAFIVMTIYPGVIAGTVKLTQNQFHESYTNEVNISGSVRAGVMTQSNFERVAPKNLFINVGQESGAELEVKMTSIDGKYEAGFIYIVDSDASGLTQFDLPTKMSDLMSKYPPTHLAVLAKLKNEASGPKGFIVPSTWGTPESNNLKILLNSGVSETILKLYRPDGSSKKVSCQIIEADTKTAYDTVCLVENSDQFDLTKSKIIRKNFDSYFKPIKLNIKAN